MERHKRSFIQKNIGALTISRMLMVIFCTGFVITALVVYSTFTIYRNETVSRMAEADVKRISHLMFEHLYSVMRKGWTRAEIDDIVHHIQTQLPDYQVTIYRGEPVVQQFGDRPGQPELKLQDATLREVLHTGEPYFGLSGAHLRYLYPVKATAECITCHTAAKLGDINGVIAVSVPMQTIATPIINIAAPVTYLTVLLVLFLLLATFVIVRNRVSIPIADLSSHVIELTEDVEYGKDLTIDPRWPQEVQILGSGFNHLMDNVRTSHTRLLEASLRDPLTELFNRRHFDAMIISAVADTRKSTQSFAVMYVDLDHFKPINDRYGHASGDAMLINVARAIRSVLRESDIAARIGGDEFAVLIPGVDRAGALLLAQRLREEVETISLRCGHETIRAACSVGIATFPEDGEYAEALLQAADSAMYQDKLTRHHPRNIRD